MIKDQQVADMTITLGSIDPCFSCTDRLIGVKELGHKKRRVLKWEELHSYSIQWYMEHGIDFSELNRKLKIKGTI